MMKKVDINCDMGESYGHFRIGNDDAIMPYISSCNIACGFHGGDPLTIKRTIELALQYEVAVGAHPSYYDILGFGRRKQDIPSEELLAVVEYQIASVKGITESLGGKLHHVKAHGALYNSAARDEKTAEIIVQAVKNIDSRLKLYGPAGNVWYEVATTNGIHYIPEVFADRRYNSDGSLVSRNEKNALIKDVEESCIQVENILFKKKTKSISGEEIALAGETICIHGDQQGASKLAEELNLFLRRKGFEIKAP